MKRAADLAEALYSMPRGVANAGAGLNGAGHAHPGTSSTAAAGVTSPAGAAAAAAAGAGAASSQAPRTPTPTYSSYAPIMDANHLATSMTTPSSLAVPSSGGVWTDEGLVSSQFYGCRQYQQMYAY